MHVRHTYTAFLTLDDILDVQVSTLNLERGDAVRIAINDDLSIIATVDQARELRDRLEAWLIIEGERIDPVNLQAAADAATDQKQLADAAA